MVETVAIIKGIDDKFLWPVSYLCERQLRDVHPEDVLNKGRYRRCDTYRGGGGYDRFPALWKQRYGDSERLHDQFVVQLQGCPLRCPYCYVTEDGVNGRTVGVSTEILVRDFKESGCGVFHLMGGAPALYIEHWPTLIRALNGIVFHSDLLLLEKKYSVDLLNEITDAGPGLYAVSVKGWPEKNFKEMTGCELDRSLLEANVEALAASRLPYYVTFTGMSSACVADFMTVFPQLDYTDSFTIDIVEYDALKEDG